MPLVRQWRRLGFVGQLVTLLSASLVLIAALTIAVVALSTANNAGDRGQATADCVNAVLGNRNGPQADDARAHIAYARSDKAFSDALADVLTMPNGSQQQRDAYDRFVVVARQKKRADDTYVRALVADQQKRDAHPFGKCP